MTRRRRAGSRQPLTLAVLLVLLWVAWTLQRKGEPAADAPLDPPAAYPAARLDDPAVPTVIVLGALTPTRPPGAEVATDQAAPEASIEPDPAPSDEPMQSEFPSAAVALLDGVNALRREAGLPELRMDPALMASAQAHSADMAAGDFCDHQGSDGSGAKARMRAAGFEGVFTGENIACGNKTAAQAVASWTDDDLHRDNLLGPRYRFAGVGTAPGRYGPSWTLDLGSE